MRVSSVLSAGKALAHPQGGQVLSTEQVGGHGAHPGPVSSPAPATRQEGGEAGLTARAASAVEPVLEGLSTCELIKTVPDRWAPPAPYWAHVLSTDVLRGVMVSKVS